MAGASPCSSTRPANEAAPTAAGVLQHDEVRTQLGGRRDTGGPIGAHVHLETLGPQPGRDGGCEG